jgi:hypothetical protein
MNYSNLPSWILAVVTGVCFALLAYKLQKSVVLWCIGGVVAALCIAAICLGLAHAAAVPYTDSEIRSMQSIGFASAVAILGIIAAILGLANRTRSDITSPSK